MPKRYRQTDADTPKKAGDHAVDGPAKSGRHELRHFSLNSFSSSDAILTQLYSKIPGNIKESENKKFLTDETSKLAAHNSVTRVERSRLTGGTTEHPVSKEKYNDWEPDMKVIEDCVAAMEELLHGHKLKYGTPDASNFKGSGATFGNSDKENRKEGRDARNNAGHDAAPNPGEGYVIVRQKHERHLNRPQFHGAFVAAVDGKDRITIEATAPTSGPASADRVAAIYDTYGTGAAGKQSFMHVYAPHYGADATVSVVVKSNNLPADGPDTSIGDKVVDYP